MSKSQEQGVNHFESLVVSITMITKYWLPNSSECFCPVKRRMFILKVSQGCVKSTWLKIFMLRALINKKTIRFLDIIVFVVEE